MKVLIGVLVLLLPLSAVGLDWQQIYGSGSSLNSLVLDPVHGRIVVGSYYGFLFMDLGSEVWTNRETSPTPQITYGLAWHPGYEGRLITGVYGNVGYGYLRLTDDLGSSFTDFAFGEDLGAIRAIERDPGDADRFFACSTLGYGPGYIFRSTSGGESWDIVYGIPNQSFYALAIDEYGTVYAGGTAGMMRCPAGGETWESAQGDLPAGTVRCLAYDDLGGRILAGLEGGALYASSDGGSTWGLLLDEACVKLALEPFNPSMMAVITEDMRILLTRDGGSQWSDASGELSGIYLRDLAFSPGEDLLYLASIQQVWKAYTFECAADPAPTERALTAYPNPFNPRTEILFELREAGPVILSLYDSSGRRARTLIAGEPLEAGTHRLSWDGLDDRGRNLPSGVYLLHLESVSNTGQDKLVLLR